MSIKVFSRLACEEVAATPEEALAFAQKALTKSGFSNYAKLKMTAPLSSEQSLEVRGKTVAGPFLLAIVLIYELKKGKSIAVDTIDMRGLDISTRDYGFDAAPASFERKELNGAQRAFEKFKTDVAKARQVQDEVCKAYSCFLKFCELLAQG